MRDPANITTVFQQAMKFLGGSLHHVIMCHGVVNQVHAFEATLKDFDDSMLINVRSMMHLTSLSIPYLKMCRPYFDRPSISILTSNQGNFADPEAPLMSVSASMVQMMIKNVALETAASGIRINGVATGVAKTAARTTARQDSGPGLSFSENSLFLG